MASSTCCCCCAVVHEGNYGMVEELGKFKEVAEPGLYCFNCCTTSVAHTISARTRSFKVFCESKTRDNVMVTIEIIIFLKVIGKMAADAWYKLSNPAGQISSYAMNVLRGMMATHLLDEIFMMRQEMEAHLRKELSAQLAEFGYELKAALVTDVSVSQILKNAMEATVTNARMKQAIQFKSEAEKMQTIKAAEGDAEAKRLSGVGLAEQRKAAIGGLQESVSTFQGAVHGISPKDIMSLLLMNQYFDAIKDISEVSHGHTVFLPDTGAGGSMALDMIEGTMAAAGANTTAMGQMHARRQASAAQQQAGRR